MNSMYQNKSFNYRLDNSGKRCYEKSKNGNDLNSNSKNLNYQKDKKFNLTVHYNFQIDEPLTEEYHDRHKISKADIKKILKFSCSEQLRMLAMLNKREVKVSVKHKILKNNQEGDQDEENEKDNANENDDNENGQDHKTQIVNSKIQTTSNVKKVLEEIFLKPGKLLSTQDRLILKNDEHKPPLPVHFVTIEVLRKCYNFRICPEENSNLSNLFELLYPCENNNKNSNLNLNVDKNVSKTLGENSNLNVTGAPKKVLLTKTKKRPSDQDQKNHVDQENNKIIEYHQSSHPTDYYTYQDKVMKWKDIDILPFGVYKRYLKMTRVIPKSLYESVYGIPQNDISRPKEYLVNGIVYYSLNKEFMLFQTEQGHNHLSGQSSSRQSKENDNILYFES